MRSRCSRVADVYCDYAHDGTSCQVRNAEIPSLGGPAMLSTFRCTKLHQGQKGVLHADMRRTGCALLLLAPPESHLSSMNQPEPLNALRVPQYSTFYLLLFPQDVQEDIGNGHRILATVKGPQVRRVLGFERLRIYPQPSCALRLLPCSALSPRLYRPLVKFICAMFHRFTLVTSGVPALHYMVVEILSRK